MGYNPHEHVWNCEWFDYACVKMTKICEKILTTSGNKISSKPYTDGDMLLSVV